MCRKRRNHSATFKAKVALQALKGDQTLAEIAEQYDIHPNQVQTWRHQLLDQAADLFASKASKRKVQADEIRDLHAKIGQLTVERDFLAGVLGR